MSSPIKIRRGGVSPVKNVQGKNIFAQSAGNNALQNAAYQADIGGTDPYAEQLKAYDEDYNYVTSTYQDDPVKNIQESLGRENFSNLTTIGVDHALNKLNIGEDYKLLGYDSYDLDIKGIYTTSNDEKKKIYQYGNITTKTQEDGSEIETINITATNHPYYGKSFTRTKSVNQERGTNKPIEDLQALLSNYLHRYNENEEPETATLQKLLIRQDDEGNYIWDTRTIQRIEEAFENGEIRMPDANSQGGQRNLYQEEEKQLMEAINKIKSRFKDGFIVSTVLNE
jgi:hypothetical protein